MCSGAQYALLMLDGDFSDEKSCKKASSAQRAKTGMCICWAVATFVAVPHLIPWGACSPEKAIGNGIWQQEGPWALYVSTGKEPPTS